MKTVGTDFKIEKNKPENKPIWLFTLENYDGNGTNLYFADWDSDVVFGGITYTRFPISHDFVSNNSSGQIDTINLTVGNVSRLLQYYLEQYDLRGKKVIIRIMFVSETKLLSTEDGKVIILEDGSELETEGSGTISDVSMVDSYYIDTYTASDMAVVFSLSSKFDVLSLQLPGRRYMRTYCSWKFKGVECGYAGVTGTCNKTPQACQAMAGGSNYQRFGAFPSVPTETIYVA